MLSRFTGFQGGDVGERVYERMCHANFKAACGLLSLYKGICSCNKRVLRETTIFSLLTWLSFHGVGDGISCFTILSSLFP